MFTTITHHEFITDNPFRLCDVGASTTSSDLRKKASKLKQQASVGIPFRVGLEQVFGSEDAERCAEIVRNVTVDAEQRTLYRVFWPIAYRHSYLSKLGDGLPLLNIRRPDGSQPSFKSPEKVMPTFDTGSLADLEALAEYTGDYLFAPQTRFLIAWYRFLQDHEADSLQEALEKFDLFYNDWLCDKAFVDLLKEEGEAEPGNLWTYIQGKAIQHLLTVSCRVARELWQAKNYPQAIDILQVVCSSSFKEDSIDRALQSISALGDREVEMLVALRDNYPGWSPDRDLHDLTPGQNIIRLTDVLGNRLPAAAAWRQEAEEYIDTVIHSIRIELRNSINDVEDCQVAIYWLTKLLQHPEASLIQDELRKDIDNLHYIKAQMSSPKQQTASPKSSTAKPVGYRPGSRTYKSKQPAQSAAQTVISRTAVAVFIAFFGLIIFLAFQAPTPTNNSSAYTLNNTTVTPEPPHFTGEAEQSEQQDRAERLRTESARLNDELDVLDKKNKATRNSLLIEKKNLHEKYLDLGKRRQSVDVTDKDAVDAYNSELDRYESESVKYDKKVDVFDAAIKAENKKYKRLETVNAALSELEQ